MEVRKGLAMESAIDFVRQERNAPIKSYLSGEVLRQYFTRNGKELSRVKEEFLKRDLEELMITPVDLAYFASLIQHVRTTGGFSGR